jgi:crossover junction endodeoxyribonuclease RuvC
MHVRVLGVDPGLRLTGYGCVQGAAGLAGLGLVGVDGALVEAGVFRLGGTKGATVSERLLELDQDITELLFRLKPDVVAVESLFAHYKHPATAISMGHARGIILLAVRKAGLPLVELKPNEVKKFLTGHGHASKEQMQASVQLRLNLAALPDPPDVADAIAIALCAASRSARESPERKLGV